MSKSTNLLSEPLGKNEKIDLKLKGSELHFHPFYGHGYIMVHAKNGKTPSLIVERDAETNRLVIRVASSSKKPAPAKATKKAAAKKAAKKTS